MNKVVSVLMLALCTLPAVCAEQAFTNAPVVDTMCSKRVATGPDAHTKACALQCQGGGFGIFTNEKKFLKFDAAGNQQLLAALKKSNKPDHLRVNVTGDVEGDTLKVKSLKLL
jgi:hypothetical protein